MEDLRYGDGPTYIDRRGTKIDDHIFVTDETIFDDRQSGAGRHAFKG